MELAWDEEKRRSNLQKHQIDFIGAKEIFEGYTVTLDDDRVSYGEQRFITFGRLQGRVVAVVHTERDNKIRLISIRKATKYEERSYYSTITN